MQTADLPEYECAEFIRRVLCNCPILWIPLVKTANNKAPSPQHGPMVTRLPCHSDQALQGASYKWLLE